MQENMYVLSIEMEDFRHGRTKQGETKQKYPSFCTPHWYFKSEEQTNESD